MSLCGFWFNSGLVLALAGSVLVLFWFTNSVDNLVSLCGFRFNSGSVLAFAGFLLVLFWSTHSVDHLVSLH